MKVTEIEEKPQFVLVMGGAGSGKNYFISHDPVLRGYEMIDVDAIKQTMDLTLAVRSVKPAMAVAFKNGQNVVHPTTGSHLKGQQNKIALARQFGYSVTLVLCKVDPLLAVQQVAKRVATGGHDVDYDAIVSSNEKARANYDILRGLVDTARVVSAQ